MMPIGEDTMKRKPMPKAQAATNLATAKEAYADIQLQVQPVINPHGIALVQAFYDYADSIATWYIG